MTHKLSTLQLYIDQVLRTKAPGFTRPVRDAAGNKMPIADKPGKFEMEVYAQGPATDFLHGTTGGVTEVGEFMDALKAHLFYGKDLDYVNLAEEVGDMWWFAALVVHAVDYDKNKLDKLINNHADQGKHHRNHSSVNAIAVLGLANKLAAHWAALNDGALFDFGIDPGAKVWLSGHPDMEDVFTKIISMTAYLGALLGHETHRIWESNIAKLVKRYPEKFTNDAALHRTLTDERAALEAHHGDAAK